MSQKTATTTSFAFVPDTTTDAGVPVTASVTVTSDNGLSTPQGTVKFYPAAGGALLGEGTLVNGSVDVDITLPPGSNAVDANFEADTNFYASSDQQGHDVSPYTSGMVVTSTGATSVVGEEVTFTATITTPAPTVATGTVTFTATPVGGGGAIGLGSPALSGGAANVAVANLAIDDYLVTATYAGSTTVSATDSNELAHSVGQAASTVTVTKAGAGAFFGYRDTITVTVEAAAPGSGTPTGDIELLWDDATITTATLISGSRDDIIDFQAAGAHVVKAVYAGDANYAGSEGTLDVSVSKRGTSVNINVVSPGSGYYGDDETFSGSVVSDAGDFASIPTGFVQLIANGTPFAKVELNASGGFSLTTDEVAVSAPGGVVDVEQDLQVYYLGDDNHGVSLAGTAGVDTFEVQKRTSQPVLTTNPTEPGVGGTMALVATMENVGFGPRGDITFYKYEFGIAVEIGTASLTDGVATLTGVPVDSGTVQYAAAFTEDLNFFSSVSEIIAVTPTRAAVTLDLAISADGAAGVSPYPFGEVITLVAEVTINGALTPTEGVTFSTENGPIVADVPVVGGYAIVQVCAGMTLGDIIGCPVGMPNVGIAPRTITATYPATVDNIAGVSNGVDYDVTGAATTTTLVVNPTSPDVGSAIYFTATVVNDDNDVEPEGYVAFYNSASATEANTLGYLGRADLVNGVAMFDTQVAAGLYYNALLDDTVQYVHFDTAGIHAEFYGGGTVFATSRDTVGLNVSRAGTSLSTNPASGPALSPTPVTVLLDHDPGYSDDYAGTVTITGDNGRECTATVPAGISAATCSITWDTVGPHTVSAAYDGDDVYEPSSMTGGVVTVTTIPSTLNPLVNPTVIAGVTTSVSWSTQNALATGDVEVWGAGVLWCTVDIQVGSCTGSFTNAHSTGAPVDIRVRYYGDAMWTAAEEVVTTTVTGCAQIDVRANAPALGTVAVNTPSNCGIDGYLIGTAINVTATVIPPAVFTGWEKYDDTSPYLVPGGQNLTTQFTLTNDTSSWVHIATFRNACYALTADATGNGRFYIGTPSDCTLPDGGKGYRDGTVVKISAHGAFNKEYGDNDVFYEFSPKLPGAVEARDYFNYPTLTFTMTSDVAVPVIYGPRCRTVTVEFDPATDGDAGTVDTADTCVSPQGTGFVPKSEITVTAATGSDSLVLQSWSLDGEVDPALGRDASATITMGFEDVTMTANYVACYTVDLELSNARVLWDWAGAASVDIEPNCPDGSERYVEGTELTFTPEVLAEAGIFIGWNGEGAANSGTGGVGLHPEKAFVMTVVEDTTVVAAFYLAEACSRLTVWDTDNLISIPENGCGEGMYFDYRKQFASVSGEPISELWKRRELTDLFVTLNEGATNADVYVNVRGDVRDCFNMTGDVQGPYPNPGEVRSGGKLDQRFNECFVGGDILIEAEQCQTMYPSQILFEVAGDTTGGRTSLNSMPQSVFLPDGTGSISKFDMYDFEWLRTYQVKSLPNGSSYANELTDTPCADAHYAFPINEPLAFEAGSYSQGITFKGFSDLNAEDFLPLNPLMVELDGAQGQLDMTVRFEVVCHTVLLEEGISISDGAVGYCPNGAPNSYIEGTGFQVTALQHIGDRISNGFKGGVLSGTVTEDPVSGDLTGLVYVDGPKTVKSDYPTSGERVERGIVQGLKISAGIAAVAVVAIGTTLFPWVGVFLAGLAISAAVSAIVPGGEDVSAFFDLINPTKITTCASQWAFGKTGGGKTEVGLGSSVKVASTSYKVYKLVNAADAAAEAAAAVVKAGEDALNAALAAGQTVGQAEAASAAAIAEASKTSFGSTAAKVGGNVLKVAGFGYELYSNGIGEIDPQANTTDELRDTAGMTECLDNAWRFAGSNTSGN